MFNLTSYFEDQQIEYHLEGEKNVTRGWVNIQCPFPGCSDPSWHCGINISSLLFHCYICGSKGSIERLISGIEKCSITQAERIIEEYDNNKIIVLNRKRLDRIPVGKCILPKVDKVFHKRHWEYLKDRNFNPDYLINKYNLMSVYNIGEYKFRIIIPYYYNFKLVSFNTRDITGRATLRYQFSSAENSVIEVKHTLYNIDTVNDRCIIVEGPTDVWNIGDGCVAVSGKQFTREQLLMIRERNIKKVVVLYDADDKEEKIGEKLANNLSGIVPYVELIELTNGDPAELQRDEVNKIREITFN